MKLEDVDRPEPSEGEALVRLEASGVNFIDLNQRSGAYPMSFPFTPGTEGAGVVEAVGGGVSEVRPKERVAFAGSPRAYSEYVTVKASRLVPVPEGVASASAAAVMLHGMTAHYLVNSICSFNEGDWCLVHAAAGGVGQLLVQLAKGRGLRVIATVGSAEKAERARSLGADVVVNYSRERFVDAVTEHTQSSGVRAAFDAVGKSTFDDSLASVARRGYLVLYGQSSGPVDPFDPRRLQQEGSVFLTRPGLADYTRTREELLKRAGEVLELVRANELQVHVHERYALEDAARAHRDLESRKTTGKLLLIP